MTKLYAYTDELSGRDGEDKISFGHFYEENGICSACADAPRHSDGLGGQKCGRLIENNECMWVTGYSGSDYRVHGYDSELCDSPECGANTFGNDPVNVEYEYGWAFLVVQVVQKITLLVTGYPLRSIQVETQRPEIHLSYRY